MKLTFASKEEALAWELHEVRRRIRETLNFPAMMQRIGFEAIIADTEQTLRDAGYEEQPQPKTGEHDD